MLLVTLAAVGAAIAGVTLRPPSYEATANILVSPLAQEDQLYTGINAVREAGDPTRTSQTAATLVRSSDAAERTAEQMGGDWSRQKVLDAVTVTPEGESNILAVTAKAEGAGESAKLANTFARQSLESRAAVIKTQAEAEIERARTIADQLGDDTETKATLTNRINALEKVVTDGDPTLELSQQATKPESPTGLPFPAIIILAALAGFTLGSGGALLLELTERRIRSEEETISLYPLPVLARIPVLKPGQLRGRQASGWHMLPAVREAFRTLLIQLGPHPEGRAQVIMVTSASTGDGKTTSAVNLAAAAAASGDPVILLDFDLRKPDVGRTLGVQPGTELTGLLQPDTQLRDLLSPAPGLPALSVLTTTVAEGDVALVEALSRRLPELIADARDLCNYVVLDTAPLGEISDALRLVADVDDIIVVTKPGNTNRANFEMMRDLLERTAYTPAGFLVIGDSTPRTSAYYAYGATGRELFLEGPPTPSSDRPRPAPTKSANEIVAESSRVKSEPRERDRDRDRDRAERGDRDRGERDRPRDRDRDRARSNGEGDAPRQAPERAKAPGERVKGDGNARPAPERNGESNGEADANRAGAEAATRRGAGESHRRPTRPPRSEEREQRPSRDKPSQG